MWDKGIFIYQINIFLTFALLLIPQELSIYVLPLVRPLLSSGDKCFSPCLWTTCRRVEPVTKSVKLPITSVVLGSENTEKGHSMCLVLLSFWKFWHFWVSYPIQLYLILIGEKMIKHKNLSHTPAPLSLSLLHVLEIDLNVLTEVDWQKAFYVELGVRTVLFRVANWEEGIGHPVGLNMDTEWPVEERWHTHWTHKLIF